MTTNPSKQAQVAEHSKTGSSNDVSFKWLILLLALVAFCLNALYFINFNRGWGSQADFGAFGDFLGGVLNPVLGFATVGLLIWSLKMQIEELSLSRKELALTRQELAETKEETSLSRKAMEDQVSHLEKEAKLNETIRLMAAIKDKYNDFLKGKVQEPEVSLWLNGYRDRTYGRYTPTLRQRTYHEVIYQYLPQKEPQLFNDISVELKKQYNVLDSNWKEIEELLCLYSNLVLKYYSIYESEEFAVVYLKEASEMLAPFHNIFVTEKSKYFLQKIIDAHSISMTKIFDYEDDL